MSQVSAEIVSMVRKEGPLTLRTVSPLYANDVNTHKTSYITLGNKQNFMVSRIFNLILGIFVLVILEIVSFLC